MLVWSISDIVPVQSFATVYVPLKVSVSMVPSSLCTPVPVTLPAPSATSRNRPAVGEFVPE